MSRHGDVPPGRQDPPDLCDGARELRRREMDEGVERNHRADRAGAQWERAEVRLDRRGVARQLPGLAEHLEGNVEAQDAQTSRRQVCADLTRPAAEVDDPRVPGAHLGDRVEEVKVERLALELVLEACPVRGGDPVVGLTELLAHQAERRTPQQAPYGSIGRVLCLMSTQELLASFMYAAGQGSAIAMSFSPGQTPA
jgi:hypothetical protein